MRTLRYHYFLMIVSIMLLSCDDLTTSSGGGSYYAEESYNDAPSNDGADYGGYDSDPGVTYHDYESAAYSEPVNTTPAIPDYSPRSKDVGAAPISSNKPVERSLTPSKATPVAQPPSMDAPIKQIPVGSREKSRKKEKDEGKAAPTGPGYILTQPPDGDDPQDVPIDGGLSLLIATGVGLGVRRMYRHKNRRHRH